MISSRIIYSIESLMMESDILYELLLLLCIYPSLFRKQTGGLLFTMFIWLLSRFLLVLKCVPSGGDSKSII